METRSLARINNVDIQIISESGDIYVPIRPICDVLGIDSKSQRERIDRDEILRSVGVVMTSTGADGKQYEMACLPFKFTFGWLFSIDTSRVNEASKEAVIKYKIECYEALFNYFTEPQTFLNEKQKMIDLYLDEYEVAKNNFKNARNIMDEKKKAFDQVRHFSIDEWRANGRQYVIPFIDQK